METHHADGDDRTRHPGPTLEGRTSLRSGHHSVALQSGKLYNELRKDHRATAVFMHQMNHHNTTMVFAGVAATPVSGCNSCTGAALQLQARQVLTSRPWSW